MADICILFFKLIIFEFLHWLNELKFSSVYSTWSALLFPRCLKPVCLKDRSKHKHHSSFRKKELFGFSTCTSQKFNFAVCVGERIFRTKEDVFAEDSHTTSYVCVLVLGSRRGGVHSNKAGFVIAWLLPLNKKAAFHFIFTQILCSVNFDSCYVICTLIGLSFYKTSL